MKKALNIVVFVVIAAIVFAWLHWFFMPSFIAGQISDGEVKIDDYFIAHLNESNSVDDVVKLTHAQRGWRAIKETWPAIIPVLLFGCSVSWYLGRLFLDNEHKMTAENKIKFMNEKMEAREIKVNDKYYKAEKLKQEAEALETETYQAIEKAKITRQSTENIEKATVEQVNLAIKRAEEAERKLAREREEYKKTHAQLMRYKEKVKEKSNSPIN